MLDIANDKKGSLLGHLLVRKMLKDQGIRPSEVKFSKTREGKPYIVRVLPCSQS